jgi:hypothetical protein
LACKQRKIRPLILLNSHQGVPCPVLMFERKVTAAAPVGATQVELDDTKDLIIGRSGLSGLTDYWAAEAIITQMDNHMFTLSKPLPKAIAAGAKVKMATLKYRPFSPPGSADYDQPIAGWLRYVQTVVAFVTDTLGTGTAPDKGFDLEIWNELTFGTHFLYINDYYQPELAKYDSNVIWSNLVRATARYVDEHPAMFQGVRIADGFANTIPWPAADQEPRAITAIDKHPYAGRKVFPKDEQKGTKLDARGQPTEYVPGYTMLFPEYFATAIQTETMVRDMGPLTSEIYKVKHGRWARGKNEPVGVWITEVGNAPNETGITDRQAALALKAKTTARYLAFFLNRGVEKLQLFGAAEGDLGLGIVSDRFAEYARSNQLYPANDADYTSPALQVIRHMTTTLCAGLEPDLKATRALRVESITDTHGHYQFTGDGTPAHPPLYDREVFAFLPYQVNAHKFVIAYYVMTRDVTQTFTPEDLTLEVTGIWAKAASVEAYDPIQDREVSVKAKATAETTLRVTLSAADYPYLLIIEE